ncbi:hypothetical protein HMPREF9554_00379 [Treponema phagedenis F0421]|nr:hypothetical protein HMPREF9554_00379 [Treponema phagedenis F0421]
MKPTSFKTPYYKKSPTRRKGEVLKIYCNFANEFSLFTINYQANIVWN